MSERLTSNVRKLHNGCENSKKSPTRRKLQSDDKGDGVGGVASDSQCVRRRVGRPATVRWFRDSVGRKYRCDYGYKSWVYTAFSLEDCEIIQSFQPELHVVGTELCPTTKRIHYQGVFRCREGKSLDGLRVPLGDRVHLEPCANINGAVAYARKDGSMVYDHGFGSVRASRSKQRDDTASDVLAIIDGSSSYMQAYEEIKRKHPIFVFWHRRKVQEALMDKWPPPGGLEIDAWKPYGGYGAE